MTQPAVSPREAAMSDTRKTVLHAGWSSTAKGALEKQFPAAQWQEVRVDPDPRMEADVVGHVERMEGVADQSVDLVYAPQLLQRYPITSANRILKEMLRVLKDEGRAVLTVPNAQLAATYLANNQSLHTLYDTKLGPITPLDLLYGLRVGIARGEPHYRHRCGFTFEQLGLEMREAGFTNIEVLRRGYEIVATGYRFPYEHPSRVERITMGPPSDVETAKPPAPPAQAAPPKNAPLRSGPGGRADELDLPPAIWKPLGLKK